MSSIQEIKEIVEELYLRGDEKKKFSISYANYKLRRNREKRNLNFKLWRKSEKLNLELRRRREKLKYKLKRG